MRKVLITGSGGFTGYHLIKYLEQLRDIELIGVDNIPSPGIKAYICNLTNYDRISSIIHEEKPGYIIHLAGISKASRFTAYYRNNVFSTHNVLKSVLEKGYSETRILLISTSAVYGSNHMKQVAETDSPLPLNFYGNSKLAMEYVALQYRNVHQLKLNIVRPFNIIGPHQSPAFVIPAMVRQLIRISKGQKRPTLVVGDLDSKRDFIDISDVVRAYWLLVNHNRFGDIYNIASGKSVSIYVVLNKLLKLFNLEVTVRSNPIDNRQNQIMDLYANISKIKNLGWLPQISLNESLQRIITANGNEG